MSIDKLFSVPKPGTADFEAIELWIVRWGYNGENRDITSQLLSILQSFFWTSHDGKKSCSGPACKSRDHLANPANPAGLAFSMHKRRIDFLKKFAFGNIGKATNGVLQKENREFMMGCIFPGNYFADNLKAINRTLVTCVFPPSSFSVPAKQVHIYLGCIFLFVESWWPKWERRNEIFYLAL